MELTSPIRWILDALPVIHSPEELALGYVLSTLTDLAHDTVRNRRYFQRVERLRKTGKLMERLYTLRDVNVTEEEAREIRDMLRRRFQDIMEQINRELGT